jgi:hypothetical protein
MRIVEVRIAALALAALTSACGGGEPPRLDVGAGTVEVAGVGRGIEARYELRNAGGRLLLLDGVVPGCGCTTASRLPPALAPGAAATLALACSPIRAVNERALRLRSSDPATPETTVPLVLPAAAGSADPAGLYFGYVAVGGSVVRDVVTTSAVPPDGSRLPPGFTVEAMPARADAATGVRVRFTPRVPGLVRAALDLGPSGTIAVSGVGYRDVLAFPAELTLPAATGARGLAGITLMGVGGDPLEITRVEYPPGVGGELRTVVPGRQFRLVVRTRGASDGAAAIRLHTDSSDEPTVVIPIVGAGSARS